LKASYVAASGSIRAREAIAALGLADDDGDRQHEDSGQAVSGAADARLAELTAQMERQLGCHGGPEGLMELRPGAPPRGDIRILSAASERLRARGVNPRANAQIAAALVISPSTVKTHINNIFAKTGITHRAQAVHYAYRNGLTDPGDASQP
jgi:DNA-binding CsgD family transcriptional regulator